MNTPPTLPPEADAVMVAILADPDADGPREAFAQGCEVQDPERARLVRLQLQLAHQCQKESSAGDSDLAEEVDSLVAKRGPEWAGTLAPWLPSPGESRHERSCICERGFVRGLVEYLAMTPADFLAHAPALRLRTPLRHLDVIGTCDDATMRELLGSQHLHGILSLRIIDAAITDDQIGVLARSRHVSSLRWLVLDSDQLTLRGITDLAASRYLGGLCGFESAAVSIADHEYSLDGACVAYSTITPEYRRLEERYGYFSWGRSSYHWWKENLHARITGVLE